ncbi:e3 ubiquitin-protein ligase [Anaeramoeba flamelloides]|uniref:E3 ubiquitin-protein ligase n=1 Tax=Anaeramoeba flamelloides TaxID=1746091 RepID=A0AAV7YYF8_9EUKA|nr:e3 ubiquitin-protein ligase [Anaeramoeba flamelloides]
MDDDDLFGFFNESDNNKNFPVFSSPLTSSPPSTRKRFTPTSQVSASKKKKFNNSLPLFNLHTQRKLNFSNNDNQEQIPSNVHNYSDDDLVDSIFQDISNYTEKSLQKQNQKQKQTKLQEQEQEQEQKKEKEKDKEKEKEKKQQKIKKIYQKKKKKKKKKDQEKEIFKNNNKIQKQEHTKEIDFNKLSNLKLFNSQISSNQKTNLIKTNKNNNKEIKIKKQQNNSMKNNLKPKKKSLTKKKQKNEDKNYKKNKNLQNKPKTEKKTRTKKKTKTKKKLKKNKKLKSKRNKRSIFTDCKTNDLRTNCPICFDFVTKSGHHQICTLSCGHIFGKQCIIRWIKNKMNEKKKAFCPVCKKPCKLRQSRSLSTDQIVVCDDSLSQELHKKLESSEYSIQNVKIMIDKLISEINFVKFKYNSLSRGLKLDDRFSPLKKYKTNPKPLLI